MKSWRRCLIIVPVLAGLASALLLSCGGGGSSGITPTIVPTSLFAVFVCSGAPPTPTPTPTPTKSATKTPTPTPTPQCSPVTSASICIPNTINAFCQTAPTPPTSLQFNAQGAFTTRDAKEPYKYRDVTNSSAWNPFPESGDITALLSYVTNGVFVALQPVGSAGCACFNVTDAGIPSQSVLVGVNQDVSNCAFTCPQIPTPTPKARASATQDSRSTP